MKRFEVLVLPIGLLSGACGPERVWSEHRWRWRAKLECWFITTCPFFLVQYVPRIRPKLEVVK